MQPGYPVAFVVKPLAVIFRQHPNKIAIGTSSTAQSLKVFDDGFQKLVVNRRIDKGPKIDVAWINFSRRKTSIHLLYEAITQHIP